MELSDNGSKEKDERVTFGDYHIEVSTQWYTFSEILSFVSTTCGSVLLVILTCNFHGKL